MELRGEGLRVIFKILVEVREFFLFWGMVFVIDCCFLEICILFLYLGLVCEGKGNLVGFLVVFKEEIIFIKIRMKDKLNIY